MRAVRVVLSVVVAIVFMGPAVSADAADNQAPVAVDDVYSVVENGVLNVPAPGGLLANDSDPDVGDTFAVSLFTGGAHVLAFGVDADGSFSFEPEADYTGPVTVGYTIVDSHGETDTAAVTITVTPNQPPVADDDFYHVVKNGILDIPAPGVLANDSDPEGGPLTADNFNGGAHTQSITASGAGALKLVLEPDYVGPITIGYTVTDSEGLTDTATAYITVTATDPSTSIVDDVYSTEKDEVLNIPSPGLLANDTVAAGSPLGACTDVTHGTVTCHADGSATFVPEPGFTGDATFVYTVDSPPFVVSRGPAAAALAANQGLVTIHVTAAAPPTTDPTDPTDPDDAADESDSLPDTGSPLTPTILGLAAMLLLAGLVTIRKTRRA